MSFLNRILSSEEEQFIDFVNKDIEHFLRCYTSKSSFHRLLIHKVAEDYQILHTFSVGEGQSRRTTVCLQEDLTSCPSKEERLMSLNRPPSARGRGRGRWSSPGSQLDNKEQNRHRDGTRTEDRPREGLGTEGRFKDDLRNRPRDGLRTEPQTNERHEYKSPRGVGISPPSKDVPLSRRGRGQNTRTRNKRPDAQIYVPRGRRQQQIPVNQLQECDDTVVHPSDGDSRHNVVENRLRNNDLAKQDVDGRISDVGGGTMDGQLCNKEIHSGLEKCHNTSSSYDEGFPEVVSKPAEQTFPQSTNLSKAKQVSQPRKSRSKIQVYVPPHQKHNNSGRSQEMPGPLHPLSCGQEKQNSMDTEYAADAREVGTDESKLSSDSHHRTKVKRVKLNNSVSKLKSRDDREMEQNCALSGSPQEQCRLSNYSDPSEADVVNCEQSILDVCESRPSTSDITHAEDPSVSDIHVQGPSEKYIHVQGPSVSDIHVLGPSTSDVNVSDHSTSDRHVSDPSPSDKHVPGPSTSDRHVPGPSPSDRHVSGPSPSDKHVPGPSPSDRHVPGPSPSDKHVQGPSPSDRHVPGPSPSDKHVPGPSPSDRHVPGPSPSDRHVPGPALSDINIPVTCVSAVSDPFVSSCGNPHGFDSEDDNKRGFHGNKADLNDKSSSDLCSSNGDKICVKSDKFCQSVDEVRTVVERESLTSQQSGNSVESTTKVIPVDRMDSDLISTATQGHKDGSHQQTVTSAQDITKIETNFKEKFDKSTDHSKKAKMHELSDELTTMTDLGLVKEEQRQEISDKVTTMADLEWMQEEQTVVPSSTSCDTDKKTEGTEHMDVDNDVCSGEEGKDEEEDDDSWDKMFDDEGECLDPVAMEELTSAIGKVKIKKPIIDYLSYKPRDPDLSREDVGHVIEIYDFPPELKTEDLMSAFQQFKSKGFDIKWVDDTHALGVFNSVVAAQSALTLNHPLLKVRALSEAARQSKEKAKRCIEFLQPYKPRPETSALTARRLVTGALGLASKVSREQRDLERQKLRQAKEKKKLMKKQKDDMWEGTYTSENAETS
ncbi:uncharacterized protein LOC132549603 isoform X2 [Ylistrum balloti]|uniref:uncharacterized protein LOC132549603 isoform X2 n=1 Tax=Ylistrum balloti TaxID=509963 RepID=UPI002905ED6F|nr:uncharacterized protein LOC132549603 isoform X2 [Ylistrum balloti]